MKLEKLNLEEYNNSIYAGFWTRLGSIMLDGIFVIPVGLLMFFINSLGQNFEYLTIIPYLGFHFWYGIYLVQKHGGTPGKLVVGLRIRNINGEKIGWKEAILRDSVSYILFIFYSILLIIAISKADPEYYNNLPWYSKSQQLMVLLPTGFAIYTWTSNIWALSELIVLLFNKRKRALHDFIAQTVVIKLNEINDKNKKPIANNA